MISRKFVTIILIFFSLTFTYVKGELTMAYASGLERGFAPFEYSCAKIRQACIEVHGEEWFKDNIILKRKYCFGSLFISNSDFMEISCKAADVKDMMALKATIDYMAACNDTLYIDVMPENFADMNTCSEYLNFYTNRNTISNYGSAISMPVGNFLRVGNTPSDKNSIITRFGIFYLGNVCVVGISLRDKYREKCRKEGYMDLSDWHFDKDKVTDRDIDLYYDFTVASDKRLLETRPTRLIPIDVHYEYNPNERIVSIKDGNVYIEPMD